MTTGASVAPRSHLASLSDVGERAQAVALARFSDCFRVKHRLNCGLFDRNPFSSPSRRRSLRGNSVSQETVGLASLPHYVLNPVADQEPLHLNGCVGILHAPIDHRQKILQHFENKHEHSRGRAQETMSCVEILYVFMHAGFGQQL